MAKPAKPSGAALKTEQPEIRNRQPSKLSSGILGMKFMQQEGPAESAEDASEESRDSKEKQFNHGYFAEEDPGRWVAPGLAGSTPRTGGSRSTASIGYADIYAKSLSGSGRRSYGAKPKRIDAEEMVKHYEEGEKRSKKVEKKGEPSRKRSSSEHAEGTRTDSRKQRRKS